MRLRSNTIPLFSLFALLLCGAVTARAQNAPLRGHVIMVQADGTTVPADGANIDVFRVDQTAELKTKTDKKGTFVFVALPVSGVYVIQASAPTARYAIITGVKSGQDIDYELKLTPGSGDRLSRADAIKAGSGGPSGTESAEQRKKREEMEAKNKELN